MTAQRWMVAGDVNQGVEAARRLIDAPNSFGHDPMAAYWSTGWRIKPAKRRYKGADHFVLRLVDKNGLRIAVVNCTWQLGFDKRLLNLVAKWADVMLLVECRTKDNEPLRVKDFIGGTHDVRQDVKSSARSGSVIAVRKTKDLHIKRSNLKPLSPEAHKVQARFLRDAVVVHKGEELLFSALHLALASTHVQDDGERSMKRWVNTARR